MHLHDHSHRQNIIGNTLVEWSDDATSTETLFHGNSIADAPVVWDDQSGLARTLPASLFLTERPGWWSETLPWPGTGSDLAGSRHRKGEVTAWSGLKQGGHGPPCPMYFQAGLWGSARANRVGK